MGDALKTTSTLSPRMINAGRFSTSVPQWLVKLARSQRRALARQPQPPVRPHVEVRTLRLVSTVGPMLALTLVRLALSLLDQLLQLLILVWIRRQRRQQRRQIRRRQQLRQIILDLVQTTKMPIMNLAQTTRARPLHCPLPPSLLQQCFLCSARASLYITCSLCTIVIFLR